VALGFSQMDFPAHSGGLADFDPGDGGADEDHDARDALEGVHYDSD
jgi:hypothetical protein